MSVVTITDWTGKLAGSNYVDFSLLASAGQFRAAPKTKVEAATLGLWPMDNNWQDMGPYAAHGTAEGSATFTSATPMDQGGDWSANTNSIVRCGTSIPYAGGAFTFEAWCYWKRVWNNYETVFQKIGGPCIQRSNTRLMWQAYGIKPDGTLHQCRMADSLPTGEWFHYAVTWDGTNNNGFRFYVNGASQARTIISQSTGTYAEYGATLIGNVDAQTVAPKLYLDHVRFSTGAVIAGNFTPACYEAASVRTGTGAVDAGVSGARWSQLDLTCAARTSNEVYAVSVAPSDTATPPAVGDGSWVSAGTALTGTATLDLTGLGLPTGRYLHTKFGFTPSTDSIQQYTIAVDALAATWSKSTTPLVILQSGQMRSY